MNLKIVSCIFPQELSTCTQFTTSEHIVIIASALFIGYFVGRIIEWAIKRGMEK